MMTSDEPQQVPVSEALRQGLEHHQVGRLQQAEAIYRAILDAEPEHAGANYNLGLIALQSGRASEAVPVLKAALDADATNAAFWMNYAVALVGSGDPGAAHSVLLQAKQRGLRGAALDGLLEQVGQVLGAQSVDTQPDIPDRHTADPSSGALSSLARLFAQEQHAELETAAARMIEQYPRSARLLHLLGASRLTRRLNQQAHDVLLLASEIAPEDPEVLNLLGVALFRLGRHEPARLAFEKSLAGDRDAYDTLVNASVNALAAGDTGAASSLAQRALVLQPDGLEALFSLGNSFAASGRSEEAAALYRRAIAIDSSAPDLYLNLGYVLTNLGKPGEAVTALEQALGLRPEHAPTHLNLGRALHDLGESAAAQRHFRAAADLDPSLAELGR